MNNQEIFELMARFDASSATSLRVVRGDFSIELAKGPAVAGSAPAPAISAPASIPPVEGKCITAPLVGTFYTSPAPGEDAFVKAGDRVVKGQTVCILEAMKMMSEVQAPCDCIIEEVLQQDGALVSFGDPLIRYREG